jgi:Metallo-peptidase family M12
MAVVRGVVALLALLAFVSSPSGVSGADLVFPSSSSPSEGFGGFKLLLEGRKNGKRDAIPAAFTVSAPFSELFFGRARSGASSSPETKVFAPFSEHAHAKGGATLAGDLIDGADAATGLKEGTFILDHFEFTDDDAKDPLAPRQQGFRLSIRPDAAPEKFVVLTHKGIEVQNTLDLEDELAPLADPGRPDVSNRKSSARDESPLAPRRQCETGAVIDIAAFYTPAAAAAAGGAAQAESIIRGAVTDANDVILPQSGIGMKLNLVSGTPAQYTFPQENRNGDLNDFRDDVYPTGAATQVSQVRTSQYADATTLMTNGVSGGTGCGIGYVRGPGSAQSNFPAVSIVDYKCFQPNFSFLHELGHNMGALHGTGDSDRFLCVCPCFSFFANSLFVSPTDSDIQNPGSWTQNAFGYADPGSLFRTVVRFLPPVVFFVLFFAPSIPPSPFPVFFLFFSSRCPNSTVIRNKARIQQHVPK